jgi:2-oxoglutarate ferredoxin oxidoreductase subunit gamma
VVDIQLDDEEIWYPYAIDGQIDFMLSVADVSYQQFKKGVREGGTIVIEPNLVSPTDEDRKKWNIVEIPIITIAKEEVGNVITQSVVALAIANTLTNALDEKLLVDTMLSKVPPRVHEANIKAYELGKKYALEASGKASA